MLNFVNWIQLRKEITFFWGKKVKHIQVKRHHDFHPQWNDAASTNADTRAPMRPDAQGRRWNAQPSPWGSCDAQTWVSLYFLSLLFLQLISKFVTVPKSMFKYRCSCHHGRAGLLRAQPRNLGNALRRAAVGEIRGSVLSYLPSHVSKQIWTIRTYMFLIWNSQDVKCSEDKSWWWWGDWRRLVFPG